MAQYTFYTHPMSRGQIARWALHEAGAQYQHIVIDWAALPKALMAANPLGKVPTLVHHTADGDRVVTEAAAICHYLAELHPDAKLLPQDAEKADYFRYLFFAAGPLEQAVIANSMGWDMDDPKKQATLGFGSFDRAVDALDTMLSGRDYVCGARFTMADVYVGSQVDWGLMFKTLPARDSFTAYAERLRARDAYKAAKAIDGKLIAEMQANKGG